MHDDEILVSTIENHFGVTLYPNDLAQVETFRQLCDVFVFAMNDARPASVPYEFGQFWPAIQQIAAEVLGLREDDVTPDTRFTDLNM